MTIIYFYHIVLMTLFAPLIFASWIKNFEYESLTQDEEDHQNLHIESIIQGPSRDEIFQMAGYGEEKLSIVLISGTLLCYKNCLAPSWKHRELYPRAISGASMGVICTKSKEDIGVVAEVVTDEYGEFIVDIPSHLHAIPKLDIACSVVIIQVPKDSPCYQSSYSGKRTKIKLSSFGHGIRTYTTGTIAVVSKISKNTKACTQVLKEGKYM